MFGNEVSDNCAEVLIDDAAVSKISELIHRDPSRECGGMLIGNIGLDSISGKYIIHVRDIFYEDVYGSSSAFKFTPDFQTRAYLYARKNCAGMHIIGNVHSHAGFEAFWSPTDNEMMNSSRCSFLYMVVSPSRGNWLAKFKDSDFVFYDCDVRVSGEISDDPFIKSVSSVEDTIDESGSSFRRVTFRTDIRFSEAQKEEFDKRYLHSVQALAKKKVLIVGAGTIGNSLAEFLMYAGVGSMTFVDKDTYAYYNIPRSSMITTGAVNKPKAVELARAVAERTCFPITVTGICADICELGWGFLADFDVVLSPVDNEYIRQYIDRGCRLYHIPHITCGTGNIGDRFTANIVYFPADCAVDLEYIWGSGYRKRLEEKRSCSDFKEETQAQLMGFSAQVAGATFDIAMSVLLEKMPETGYALQYFLQEIGRGFPEDAKPYRVLKYKKIPEDHGSELFDIAGSRTGIPSITFDRSSPKDELCKELNALFGGQDENYTMNLEWSLNIPLAYNSADAHARIEILPGTEPEPLFNRLPNRHIYRVDSEDFSRIVEIVFTGSAGS